MIHIRTALLAATIVLPWGGAALAQAAQPAAGAVVRDAAGEVLGRIESVTLDNTGRPVQVVVRTQGLARVRPQSRALPIDVLKPERDGWSVPLKRAEFDLLPKLAK
jgi:hypothetical protein